jgi:hypothetical protein
MTRVSLTAHHAQLAPRNAVAHSNIALLICPFTPNPLPHPWHHLTVWMRHFVTSHDLSRIIDLTDHGSIAVKLQDQPYQLHAYPVCEKKLTV